MAPFILITGKHSESATESMKQHLELEDKPNGNLEIEIDETARTEEASDSVGESDLDDVGSTRSGESPFCNSSVSEEETEASGEHQTIHHRDSISVGMTRASSVSSIEDMMKRGSHLSRESHNPNGRTRSILKLMDVADSGDENEDGTSSRQVKFNAIEIREYPMTLGDHPNCSYGPPVTLDWDYEELGLIDVNHYELARPNRRNLRQMMMNYYHRKNLLMHHWGFTKEELKAATKEVNKTKRQRKVTEVFLPVRKVEEAAASARRKLKRAVGKGDRPATAIVVN